LESEWLGTQAAAASSFVLNLASFHSTFQSHLFHLRSAGVGIQRSIAFLAIVALRARLSGKNSCAKKYCQTLSGDTENSLVPPSECFCRPFIFLLEKLHNRVIKLPEIELTVFRTALLA
jgi:hypothetical protein